MARIRSIFPSIYTDEAWASVSISARWLACGLLTEADDNGVFEWKPLQLKMRIFPADAVDVVELLAELDRAEIVKRFEYEEKQYGALRNFCKYQRPRKPKSWFPLPRDVASFVAQAERVLQKSELGASEMGGVPQRSGMSPQMEDGGGSRDDGVGKKTEKSRHQQQPALADEFERFFSTYPMRGGANPRAAAYRAFRGAVEAGVSAETIIAGAAAYAFTHKDLIGTKYIPHASNWLARREWEDQKGLSEVARAAGRHQSVADTRPPDHHFMEGDERLTAWDAYSIASRGRGYPRDNTGGWRFPAEWPPGHRASNVTALPNSRRAS